MGIDRHNPEVMQAYADVKERFGLRAAQRTMLDYSEYYESIMSGAIEGDWDYVEELLTRGGILAKV